MKKTLSIVLTLAMLIGMLPVMASAADNTMFEMTDFGLWGSQYPDWYNVGWKMLPGFDTATITAIEVGLKDPNGALIMKYTAGESQLAYQRDPQHLYIPAGSTGGNCSAPFYPGVTEGDQTDWFATYGPAKDNFNVASCYVTITAGAVSFTETMNSSHTHNFVDGSCTDCSAKDVVYTAPVYGGPVMNQNKVAAAQNGYVKTSPLAASEGATITIYSFANEGFELASVTVTDKNGEALELTKNSAGRWTYKVPAGGVTVTPVFAAK